MVLSNVIKYGTVTWTALSAVVDDLFDNDRNPNATPIPNVVVTFTASTPRVVVQDPAPVTVFLQSITARTNADGVLVGPDGVEGIKLVATDNVLASPVNFTYRVNISGVGVPITIDVAIPSDEIIDLSFLVPVITSAGKMLAPERGPQGIPGPPPELEVGTVIPTDSPSKAAAYFRPNPDGGHFLDLDLPIGPQGEKGDPGGWVASSDLGTADLDTITTPGLYRASTAANVTLERHYPVAGGQGTGVLEVIWQGGTVTQAKMQRYTIVWGDRSSKVIFVRHYLSSSWGPWERFLSQKVVTDTNGFKQVSVFDDISATDVAVAGPGGLTRPQKLGALHLNRLYTPGFYEQSIPAQATLANGYPVAHLGTLRVEARLLEGETYGPSVIQTFTPVIGNNDREARVEYKRSCNGYFNTSGVLLWSPWVTHVAQRVTTDANGFKQVYTWDDTAYAELPIGGSGGMHDPVTLDVKLDLNTLTSSGSYSNGIGVTTTQNYPIGGTAGLTQVRRVNGQSGLVYQEWTPFPHDKGLNLWARGTYVRMLNTNSWSPWNFIPMQRVDNAAGKAIYTWDDTVNREQLIYGDTGWRDIKGLLGDNYKSGALLFRRTNYTVELVFEVLQFNKIPTDRFIPLPLPDANSIAELFVPLSTPNYTLHAIHSFNASWGGNHRLHLGAESDAISGYCTYPIRNRWPTTLPGVASGTIPNL